MSAVNLLLHQRQRLVQLCEVLDAQRANWWQQGKFSSATLAEAQAIAASLPNLRDESLAALAKLGNAPAFAGETLSLTGIGWNDRPLAELEEVQRIGVVEQAIARLVDVKDAALLASAVAVAQSLPNYRDDWQSRLKVAAAWAERHREEIEEQESIHAHA